MLIVEDCIVTMECRAAIKELFHYYNLSLSVKLISSEIDIVDILQMN
jgi:hypothetical protein